jgi:RimJ/RimL family protein N-acetyltransferase
VTLARDTDRIESERLIFRRIEQADFEFFARIHADPIVARYLGSGKSRSIQETHALLETFYETYKSLELGPLAVLRKSDGVLIGRCGLRIRTSFSSKNLDIPLTETTGDKDMPVKRRPECSNMHPPQCRFDASFP